MDTQPTHNPRAALMIIGNEILSGQTQDLNIHYLASRLFSLGIEVKRVSVVSDHIDVIAQEVKSLSAHHDYVFTTGGIGPTHDDVTAQAIAQAFDAPLYKNPEALRRLYARYPQPQAPQAMERMAYIPQGADMIDNPMSAAPGFRIENVFVMAGIPAIMQAMFETLIPLLQKGTKRQVVRYLCHVPESVLAQNLGLIQSQYHNVEIGSYPRWDNKDRGVVIVLKGHDPLLAQACRDLAAFFQKEAIEYQPLEE